MGKSTLQISEMQFVLLCYFSVYNCSSFACSNRLANSSKKETQEGFEWSREECGRDSRAACHL